MSRRAPGPPSAHVTDRGYVPPAGGSPKSSDAFNTDTDDDFMILDDAVSRSDEARAPSTPDSTDSADALELIKIVQSRATRPRMPGAALAQHLHGDQNTNIDNDSNLLPTLLMIQDIVARQNITATASGTRLDALETSTMAQLDTMEEEVDQVIAEVKGRTELAGDDNGSLAQHTTTNATGRTKNDARPEAKNLASVPEDEDTSAIPRTTDDIGVSEGNTLARRRVRAKITPSSDNRYRPNLRNSVLFGNIEKRIKDEGSLKKELKPSRLSSTTAAGPSTRESRSASTSTTSTRTRTRTRRSTRSCTKLAGRCETLLMGDGEVRVDDAEWPRKKEATVRGLLCHGLLKKKILSKEGDDDLYVIEKIIGKKTLEPSGTGKQTVLYLVKWLDWSIHDTTWEPTENIAHLNNMLFDFDQSADEAGLDIRDRVVLLPEATEVWDEHGERKAVQEVLDPKGKGKAKATAEML